MKKKIINSLKFLVFISLGIFIFWKVYKGQDVNELWSSLHEVNFLWVYVSIFFGIFSHLARSARWLLLARSLGYRPSPYNSFFAVMMTYFANLAFPRMGEVTRCAIIKQYEKIPLSTALGTIITERLIDLIMLAGITLIAVGVQFNVFELFVTENPAISANVKSLFDSGIIIGAIVVSGVVAIVLYFTYRNRLNKFSLVRKFNEKVTALKDGLLSVRNVENKWLFGVYTLTIWIFYFGMLYICFFSFPFMDSLGPLAALVLFVLGSYGMVAPVQGGIGAYHFMVISGLVIYGVADSDARLFALIAWGSQTIMIIGMGILSYVALPIYNGYLAKKNKLETDVVN
ncbi:MAG: lysylphosphatidylglycerol synthase transmembrane domain-containing protein [Salinivirgaceae bacterium]|nr:lysylphosphatidylglycerol synthase transmembrane domain-containing protein [Salinivirgaceae bacterium]